MKKLATSSGTIIYENENKLYLIKKPAPWTSTFLFVTGLLAFILFANGLLQLFVFDISHVSPFPGVLLLALGILCAAIFWRITAFRKKLDNIPIIELPCICIIDLNSNRLLDSQQHVLASLADVKLLRKMQLTSSSPSLMLSWDKNSLTIVEGNPFSGGIAAVEKILIEKGIKRN